MTYTFGNLLTIGSMIVAIAVAYGILKTNTQSTQQEVNNLKQQCKECRSKVDMEIQKMSDNQRTIEQRIYTQIGQIKAIMAKQTTAVQVLASKVQYFIKTILENKRGWNND